MTRAMERVAPADVRANDRVSCCPTDAPVAAVLGAPVADTEPGKWWLDLDYGGPQIERSLFSADAELWRMTRP